MNQQNPNPFQPPHMPHHGHHMPPDAGKGKGIASMVCGIVSLVAFAAPFFGLGAAIAGLILAQSAARDGYNGAFKTAGLVCSIIGVVLGAIVTVSILGVVACLPFFFMF